MRLFILLILSTLSGCVTTTNRDWYINGSSHNQVVCFNHPAGLSAWRTCSDWAGEGKTACEAETLLTYQGMIISDKTTVGVHMHTAEGYSSVQMAGKEMFCPTVQVRK